MHNGGKFSNRITVYFLVLVAIMAGQYQILTEAESNTDGKVITANKFILLDKKGKERAKLEVNNGDEARLVIMDGKSKGKTLIGWTEHGPKVELYSKDGIRRMDAGIKHNGVAYCRLKGNDSFYSILRDKGGDGVLIEYNDVFSKIELHGESYDPSLTLRGGWTPKIIFGGDGIAALFSMGLDVDAKRPELYMADPLLNYQFDAAQLMAAVYYVEQVMAGKKPK